MLESARPAPTSGDFDEAQRAVIQAPAELRMIVEAGPGTGKTATACARVAQLLKAGIAPPQILLVSFTRTAVVELRNRIRLLAQSVEAADAVRIATLDSEAWRLRYGFTSEDAQRLFGGFEESIKAVLAILQKPSDEVLDHFERLRHVIIDEAQDLTEKRAELALQIVKILAPEAGVTIFGDPQQAIYGWTGGDDDDDDDRRLAKNLLDLVERKRFESLSLKTVYRAKAQHMVALFHDARATVLGKPPLASGDAADASELSAPSSRVLEFLKERAAPLRADVRDEILYGDPGDCGDVLLLHRTRVEVLRRSAELLRLGRPHRVRIPGYPRWLRPEVARLYLRAPTAVAIDETAFQGFAKDAGMLPAETEDLWSTLRRVAAGAGGQYLDTKRMVERLSTNAPDELLVRDGGVLGPTLSTIHASKGREASRVVLFLAARAFGAKSASAAANDEEAQLEARVLYVAATRAHEELLREDAEYRPTTKTSRGRSFVLSGRGASIEIGLDGDVEFLPPADVAPRPRPQAGAGAAPRAASADTGGSRATTEAWLAALGQLTAGEEVFAVNEGPPWAYRLFSPRHPDVALARLAATVDSDLFECAHNNSAAAKPSPVIANLFVTGFQSLFPSAGSALGEALDAVSLPRALVAPVIRGFPFVGFQVPNK